MKKWKRLRKKVKNFLLKSITFIAVIAWIVAGSCLDSECWIPFWIILILASLWITIFAYANGAMKTGEMKDE